MRGRKPRPPFPVPPSRGLQPISGIGAVIGSIYPNARVTSTHRDPNSALGRANPRSWHNRTDAAADVAPIPGMSFDDYVNGFKSRGYGIIESRDEAAHPLPWTTGPNWHVVLGKPYGGQ